MKIIGKYVVVVFALLLASVYSINYFSLGRQLSDVISSDVRNKGITFSAHYKYYVWPSVLVINLNEVSNSNSPADVFRVLLQYSSKIQGKSFDRVLLSYKGKDKFEIEGEYFQTLGREFESQNPIYTLRTFPENLYKLDGTKAYGSWTGGWLGVVSKQMEDFGEFHQDWYIKDMVAENVAH